jgi:hypothetical protein
LLRAVVRIRVGVLLPSVLCAAIFLTCQSLGFVTVVEWLARFWDVMHIGHVRSPLTHFLYPVRKLNPDEPFVQYPRSELLSYEELSILYFESGTTSTAFVLESFLHVIMKANARNDEVIIQATNERLIDRDENHHVPCD